MKLVFSLGSLGGKFRKSMTDLMMGMEQDPCIDTTTIVCIREGKEGRREERKSAGRERGLRGV